MKNIWSSGNCDMRNIKIFENKNIQKSVILFFSLFLLLGFLIIRNYSISTDEPCERETTASNIKFMLDCVGIDTSFIDVPELTTNVERYYGTFLQWPCALSEAVLHSAGKVYLFRHLYTFFVCFIGYIFFYLSCTRVFRNKWLGLLGTAMLMLYPRFFAEQFYNIKDMLFMAISMVAMYCTISLIQSGYQWKWVFIFSIVAAVSANVRIIGFMYILVVAGFTCISGLLAKKEIYAFEKEAYKNLWVKIIALVGISVIVYILIFPIMWTGPISQFKNALGLFSDYGKKWNGYIVFMGKVFTEKDILPWYYVPMWMAISLPIWYGLLILVSAGVLIGKFLTEIKNHQKMKAEKADIPSLFVRVWSGKYKFLLWSGILFLGPWLGIVIMQSTLYNGWRHCYFFLPYIIFSMLFGLEIIWNKCKSQKLQMIFFLLFIPQLIWMVKYHPYEMVYLNEIGSMYGECFDRDYWHMSADEQVKYVLDTDLSEHITISVEQDYYKYLLDEDDYKRLKTVKKTDNPDYIVMDYRGVAGNDPNMEGYEEVRTIWVNGYKISSLMKKVNE